MVQTLFGHIRLIAFIIGVGALGLSSSHRAFAASDLTRLPLGDGHISARPEQGSVWPCRTETFGTRRTHGGEWIKSDGTFDFANKPTTEGEVIWPHQITISLDGNKRRIVGNDLPKHPTGEFPIPPTSKVYRYDTNPNRIRAQEILVELPASPSLEVRASCVPFGAIGILLTGGLFFNALDANGEDAVAHEIQDKCQGHPQRRGMYHYHNLTTCQNDEGTAHSALVGFAFDGFGLFGRRGEGGMLLSNSDLDECHGHTHEIPWDGNIVSMYHYHATWEYPYTVGCFKGTPQHLPRPERPLRRDRPSRRAR
jgi:YHYH protein